MKQAVIVSAARSGMAKSFRGSLNLTHGATVNRYCSSGLQTIAMAANAITQEGAGPMVAGGVESISLTALDVDRNYDPWLKEHHPDIYMTMIETADIVAERYGVSREDQDAYALTSQQRMAAAQEAGLFADEIVPMQTMMAVKDKETGEITHHEVTVDRDECNRPNTTLDGLQAMALQLSP